MRHSPLAPGVLLVFLGFLGGGAAATLALRRATAAEPAAEPSTPIDFQKVIATAKQKVYPALVFVKPVQEDLSEGESQRVEVLGSGVIFRPDGYLVTNHHVAEKAKEIRCVLGDRRQVTATVVGHDKLTDLAVLKLDLPAGQTVPAADFAEDKCLEEGQFVLALGSPYGFERSISLGIISNACRYFEGDEHPYNNWIQTDAAINPGNSGGPLVDTNGQVIGINTLAIRQANNLGFAVPVEIVRRVVTRIMADGRIVRSRHGLTLRALVDYTQNSVFEGEDGVIVDDVAPGSAAERAGLRKGDRLMAVGGKATNGKYKDDLPEIHWTLADLPADTPVEVEFRKSSAGSEETNQLATLVPEPDLGQDDDGLECDRWDLTFQRITPEEVPELYFWRPKGVYVLGVSWPGNAAASGLRPQDVVLAVDGEEVPDLPSLDAVYDKVMEEKRAKKRVLFEVLRNGHKQYVALEYERDYDREK